MILVPDLILSLFIHVPETLLLTRMPLQLTGVAVIIDGLSLVLMYSLLGPGMAAG